MHDQVSQLVRKRKSHAIGRAFSIEKHYWRNVAKPHSESINVFRKVTDDYENAGPLAEG